MDNSAYIRGARGARPFKKTKITKRLVRKGESLANKNQKNSFVKNKNQNVINIKINTQKSKARRTKETLGIDKKPQSRVEIIHHYSQPQLQNFQPYNISPTVQPNPLTASPILGGLEIKKPVVVTDDKKPPVVTANKKKVVTIDDENLENVVLNNKPFTSASNMTSNTDNSLAVSSDNSLYNTNIPLFVNQLPPDYYNDTDIDENVAKRMTERRQRKSSKNVPSGTPRNLPDEINDMYKKVVDLYKQYDTKSLKTLKPLNEYIKGDGRTLSGLKRRYDKVSLLVPKDIPAVSSSQNTRSNTRRNRRLIIEDEEDPDVGVV